MESTVTTAMTLDLLVCPGCRTWSAERIDVRTLERDGDFLVCECRGRYPIIDGVPIVLRDPAAFLRNEIATVIERDLPPELGALLAAGGPDDAPYPHLLEHVSIYLDAHWGDLAEPPPDGPGAGFALAPFIAKLEALPRVELAAELGCSAGRVLAELPAEHVIGIDLQFGTLRRARKLLAGERLSYARRAIGRTYTTASVTGRARTANLACSDVLDPPLVPGAFDRVVALNMVDSVAHPRQLLEVIHGLCKPGGEIILSSPYAWQSSVVHDDERLGGADPAAAVTAFWRDRGYVVEDEAELVWTLRRDARSAVTYQTHFLRARKGT